MADRISIVKIMFQIQYVSYLVIDIRSSQSANQHDLYLVIDIERVIIWS